MVFNLSITAYVKEAAAGQSIIDDCINYPINISQRLQFLEAVKLHLLPDSFIVPSETMEAKFTLLIILFIKFLKFIKQYKHQGNQKRTYLDNHEPYTEIGKGHKYTLHFKVT